MAGRNVNSGLDKVKNEVKKENRGRRKYQKGK
jgi:hypothetical protein